MLELMTDEECFVAECFFGFCWWLGARDAGSPHDPATRIYRDFTSGAVADQPALRLAGATHAELESSPTLATEILQHGKLRLVKHAVSIHEERRWRAGMDVDTHLPAFIARATDRADEDERIAAARGLIFDAFYFGAITAAMSGGRHGDGLGPIAQTADYYAGLFEQQRFPVTKEQLLTVIREAAAAPPGCNGVFVVIPFVDEDDPDNLEGVQDNAAELVDYLATGGPFPLTSQILDDRDLVSEVARHLDLRPMMATNGVFVTIPLINPDDPDDVPGVLRNAARLVETLGDVPALVLDDPELVVGVINYLAPEDESEAADEDWEEDADPLPDDEPEPSKRRRWFRRS
jgi:hypothetical protein